MPPDADRKRTTMREWLLSTSTPSWFWGLLGVSVVLQLVVDGLAQAGFGVAAVVLASAAVLATALFLRRLPPSRHRLAGVCLISISVAFVVGRNAAPSRAMSMMDWATELVVTVAVAVSLSRLVTMWIASCDRRRTARTPS